MGKYPTPEGLDGWVGWWEAGMHRRPQKRLDRQLEEVAKAVGGGYCRLQMPLKLHLASGRQWLGIGPKFWHFGPPGSPPPPREGVVKQGQSWKMKFCTQWETTKAQNRGHPVHEVQPLL